MNEAQLKLLSTCGFQPYINTKTQKSYRKMMHDVGLIVDDNFQWYLHVSKPIIPSKDFDEFVFYAGYLEEVIKELKKYGIQDTRGLH